MSKSYQKITLNKYKLVRTTDGGRSWTAVSSFLPIDPYTLVYVPQTNNSVIMTSSLQGFAQSQDGGETWKIFNTQPSYALSFVNPTTGWAAGSGYPNGYILKFAGDLSTAVAEQPPATQPTGFHLAQNYPNPFNPSTMIQYQLPHAAPVRLAIYNLLGEKIRTLVDAKESAGVKQVTWDGRDEHGERVSSGVYLYRLEAGALTLTRRLVLMK